MCSPPIGNFRVRFAEDTRRLSRTVIHHDELLLCMFKYLSSIHLVDLNARFHHRFTLNCSNIHRMPKRHFALVGQQHLPDLCSARIFSRISSLNEFTCLRSSLQCNEDETDRAAALPDHPPTFHVAADRPCFDTCLTSCATICTSAADRDNYFSPCHRDSPSCGNID